MNDNDKQPENGSPNPWMKSLLVWVAIFVGLALFVTLIDGRSAGTANNTLPYSAFLDKVEEAVKAGLGIDASELRKGERRAA